MSFFFSCLENFSYKICLPAPHRSARFTSYTSQANTYTQHLIHTNISGKHIHTSHTQLRQTHTHNISYTSQANTYTHLVHSSGKHVHTTSHTHKHLRQTYKQVHTSQTNTYTQHLIYTNVQAYSRARTTRLRDSFPTAIKSLNSDMH